MIVMLKSCSLFSCRRGASAIEFAIVAPVFLLTLMTLIAFAIYLATAHAVQQIAADSARIAVAGLSEMERTELARAYIRSASLDYPFIDPDALDVAVRDAVEPGQFTVHLAYDAGDLPIWSLFTYALPDRQIERFSTIRIGGL